MASRAACDPDDGYIAGPGGPCRPSDLRCVEREWRRVGDVVYYPDLGICGRNHEDGGTVVRCPAGMGAGARDRTGDRGDGDRPGRGNRDDPDASSDRDRDGGSRDRDRGGDRDGNRRDPDSPDATEPPRPPSRREARRAACPSLPDPVLHRNPDPEGITGMETWLWADRHSVRRGSGTVRGYRVTCTARPERWTWHTGDGASYSRSSPGDEPPRHAAEHVYRRKGSYTQRLVVRWRLVTSHGTTTTTRESSRSYQVTEVRGALVE